MFFAIHLTLPMFVPAGYVNVCVKLGSIGLFCSIKKPFASFKSNVVNSFSSFKIGLEKTKDAFSEIFFS